MVYEEAVAGSFFSVLRGSFGGQIACEPRHASWFTPEAEGLLTKFQVGRVAADPALAPGAEEPGGWKGLVYYRLHGSPTIYRSAYSSGYLRRLAERLQLHTATNPSPSVWCTFDNTAEGAATGNALELVQRLSPAASA